MSIENPKGPAETNEDPELKSAVELAMEKTDKYVEKEEIAPVEEDSGPELKSAIELAMEKTAKYLDEVDEAPIVVPEPVAPTAEFVPPIPEAVVNNPEPAVDSPVEVPPIPEIVPEPGDRPEVAVPETTPTREDVTPRAEVLNTPPTPEEILAGFTPENRGFLGRMSNRAKNVASSIYEGIYKTPVVNRLAGKLEIAYNQLWMNRHESKAAKLKGKIDDFDRQSRALDTVKGRIETVVSGLRQKNAPGMELFEIKMRDIDQQKAELTRKKNKVQTKFESRKGKMPSYTNERDRIANKLIDRYSEKIAPMEQELEKLSNCKDRLDLDTAVIEARHADELRELGSIEREKSQLEEALKATGSSERNIRNTTKPLTDYINGERERMKTERDTVTKRKAEINRKIAKVDRKANPYRDKREDFASVKARRPLKLDVPTRKRGVEFKGEEEAVGHPRGEADEDLGDEPDDSAVESAVEETHTAREFVESWNTFIQKKNDRVNYGEPLNQATFLSDIQAFGLGENTTLNSKNFRAILVRYYILKKIPVSKVGGKVDEFISQMA